MYYTKYRPQTFSEVLGTSEAAEALSKQIVSGKTVHAYLFVGSRGTGKTSTARILAKALNCTDIRKNGNPCGKCASCISITEGNFLDLHEIDAASNRGIDDIRDLRERIKLVPSIGKTKVYIIDEVHMLTTEAFNALLKTLEEPPKHTAFILCTTELHKVPETIKSRCQVFKFKRATNQQLIEKLQKIVKEEKLKITSESLEKIARASTGGFRDAETMLQQVCEGEVDIDNLLSASAKQDFQLFLKYIWEGDTGHSLETVASLYEEGVDLYVWVGEFLRYLRSLLLLKSGVSIDSLDYSKDMYSDSSLISSLDIPRLVHIMENFLSGHSIIKTSYVPQVPVEIAILKSISRDNPPIRVSSQDPTVPLVPVSIKKSKKTSGDTLKNVEPSPKDDPVQVSDDSPEHVETTLEATLDDIANKWEELLDKVKMANSSIQALLKSGKVIGVTGKFVILEVYFSFHKERLESPKNRSIVEKVLGEIHGKPLSIKCELSSNKPKHLADREVGVLTDLNVVVPGGEKYDRDSALSMLDGGLPL